MSLLAAKAIVYQNRLARRTSFPRTMHGRNPKRKVSSLGYGNKDEWLLFLKLPDYAARKKPQRKPDMIQLPLLDSDENHQQEVLS